MTDEVKFCWLNESKMAGWLDWLLDISLIARLFT
jgi:hypothetical protein